MKNYQGVIIDKSLKSSFSLDSLDVISQRHSPSSSWTLLKVNVNANKLEEQIKMFQSNMVEGPFYCHFYNKEN